MELDSSLPDNVPAISMVMLLNILFVALLLLLVLKLYDHDDDDGRHHVAGGSRFLNSSALRAPKLQTWLPVATL